MGRQSTNEYDEDGHLINGYDYDLQVWVVDYIIPNCGHPDRMRPGCCRADLLQGQDIRVVV